jgi:glutathione S-transferase
MSEEVVFYSSPMSRGRVVHWMLEEAGAPYRYEMVNLETRDQKKPAYLAVGACCVEPAVIDRMLARPAVSKPGALSYGCYEDATATLEGALQPGPFLLGRQFSAADVYVGSQIGFGLMTKALEARPAFQEYLGRLQERPAYQRFLAKTEELLAQMKKAS